MKIERDGEKGIAIKLDYDDLVVIALTTYDFQERLLKMEKENTCGGSFSDAFRILIASILGTEDVPKDFFEKDFWEFNDGDDEYYDWITEEAKIALEPINNIAKVMNEIFKEETQEDNKGGLSQAFN